MNVTQRHVPLAPRTPVAVQAQAGSAPHSGRYRARDFGIGYGASSGYALDKRYTSDWGQARFRCR
jgi:hypothetical protein